MWQDYVLTATALFFCVTLIPMLFVKEKPPLLSSIPTGVTLLIIAFVYTTLHLWIAAAGSSIVGLQWLLLAWQRFFTK